MTSVDRGEHTETATRAVVGQEQRNDIMRHTSMTRARCEEVLDAFAAAVRAEEREQIAHEYREHFHSHRANGEPTHWHQGCSGCSEWVRQLAIARDSS